MRKLKELDGIGPKMLKDFELLGVANIDQLKKQSGRRMYDRLCELTGQRQDPCVLDVFVCAVAQAKDPNLPAEQRNWWHWSRVRKGQIR
ncbi:mitomycin resistance protein [Paludibaculum fermentans]|uniref:Mitomycin resistance protein n=1 Tax=Paludibaculum fermentans TaxID=1473598 RepID=A0A7S7NY39_PALFE|nr:mitomycin resistance protein [Paludibaculum fermentans]